METSAQIVRVPFRGGEIEAVRGDGDKVYAAIRPMCDRLGVDASGQMAKIKDHPVLASTMEMISMVAADGKTREVACLERRGLPLWLAGIHPSKVAPEVRDALAAFQLEAAEVLSAYFFGERQVQAANLAGLLEAAAARASLETLRQLHALPVAERAALLGLPTPATPTDPDGEAFFVALDELGSGIGGEWSTNEALGALATTTTRFDPLRIMLRLAFASRKLPSAAQFGRLLGRFNGQVHGGLRLARRVLSGKTLWRVDPVEKLVSWLEAELVRVGSEARKAAEAMAVTAPASPPRPDQPRLRIVRSEAP